MFGLGLGNFGGYGAKSLGGAVGKGVLEGVTGRSNPTWSSVLGIDTGRLLQNPARVVNEVVRDVISGKKSITDIPSMLMGGFGNIGNRMEMLSNPDNWVDLLSGRNSKLTTKNPYVASAQPTTDPGITRFRNKQVRGYSDVEEFRQIVSQSMGYARPTHFELEIIPPAAIFAQFSNSMKRINWNCTTTDLPQTILGFFEKRTGSHLSSIASSAQTIGEFNATFMVSSDYIERNLMETWQLYAVDRFNSTLEYKINYSTNARIIIHSQDSRYHGEVASVFIKGVYPKAVMPINVNYNSGNQIMEMQVVFGYDEYFYVFNSPTGNTGFNSDDALSIVASDPWVSNNIINNLPTPAGPAASLLRGKVPDLNDIF